MSRSSLPPWGILRYVVHPDTSIVNPNFTPYWLSPLLTDPSPRIVLRSQITLSKLPINKNYNTQRYRRMQVIAEPGMTYPGGVLDVRSQVQELITINNRPVIS
jgi:hypothetical protein